MHHPSLSWEAIGVLCWAQTQPTFTLKNLLRKGTGRDRAYRILRELLHLGYLERFEHRNESGKFLEYGYRASRPNPEGPEAGPTPEAAPLPDNPLTANPYAVTLPKNPLTANPEAVECVSCTEQSTQEHFPLTANPYAAPLPDNPLTANPHAVTLPENPLTANPHAAECASCEEKDSQSRFPFTAEPHTEQPLTANPEAAPEDSSRGTENVSHTEMKPLTEKPQTDEQPLFFKSLKEEILNELLSVFNKQFQ